MSRRVEIESRSTIFDDIFEIEEAVLRHELEDGSLSAPMRRLDFERGDSAAALVVLPARRVCVMAEQFRYSSHKRGEGWLLEIPAGIVEADETPEMAIRREILEEVGYRVDDLIPIATMFPSPGACSERVFVFCALVEEAHRVSDGGGVDDEQEAIEIRHLPFAEIDRFLASTKARDGKTVLALTWLQLRRARGELEGAAGR